MPHSPFDDLAQTMKSLRAPDGCPWDRAQTLVSLKPFLIEETYEVIDAIDGENEAEHLEELGDLLFQIVFQSQIRSEQGGFDFNDVAQPSTIKCGAVTHMCSHKKPPKLPLTFQTTGTSSNKRNGQRKKTRADSPAFPKAPLDY